MIKINELEIMTESNEMMRQFKESAGYFDQMCISTIGCRPVDVDQIRMGNPDAPWVPDLRLREALSPGCSAGFIFRKGGFMKLHWVMVDSVEPEGFYRGYLAYPLSLKGKSLWRDEVLFAPRHICAATPLSQKVIGKDDRLPPPSGQAAKRTGLWNPCAGCSLDSPLCKKCDAIDHLRDLAAGKVPLPAVKRNLGIAAAWREFIGKKGWS